MIFTMQTGLLGFGGFFFPPALKSSKVNLKFLVQVKHIKEPECWVINIP